MSWTASRFSGGWHIGYYPSHDRDWQLSLCRQSSGATWLDFGKGETRHDWRLEWTSKFYEELVDYPPMRRLDPVPKFRIGRLKLTNWASR